MKISRSALMRFAPLVVVFVSAFPALAGAQDQRQGNLEMLSSTVRHELSTLPEYDVFDWLEADVSADGEVVLRGTVVEPVTRRRAGDRTRAIGAVTSVENEIEVLAPSPADDRLRVALYRELYAWESPLFRYATRNIPPIHIIVDGGRVTLKGTVPSQVDRQYAGTTARGVQGVLDVTNELRVDGDGE